MEINLNARRESTQPLLSPAQIQMKRETARLQNHNTQNMLIDLENVDYVEPQSKASRSKNDIKEVKSYKQLEKLELDLDSPRFLQACQNLGIHTEECQKKSKTEFMQKGVDQDLTDLRYKHFQQRLIDTLNRVLQERRNLKIRSMQKTLIEQKLINKSQSVANLKTQQIGMPNNNTNNLQLPQQNYQKQNQFTISQQSYNIGQSILMTEVGIVDQSKRNNIKSSQQLDFQKQTLQVARNSAQTASLNSPQQTSMKFLFTKQAFKDLVPASTTFPLQSSQPKPLNLGSQSQRYDMPSQQNKNFSTYQSKTMGTSFRLNSNPNNFNNSTYNLKNNFQGASSYRNFPQANMTQSTISLITNPIVDQKIKIEQAKIEREKSLKLMKVQKQIENFDLNKKRLEEHEKKLDDAEKRMLKKLKSQTDLKKTKNTRRLIEVQARALNLSREYEHSVLKEIERQNQSMNLSVAKHMQLESERRAELIRREEEYAERVRQIQEWKLERQQMEDISLGLMKQSIDEKLNRSQSLHDQQIRRVASEARIKNDLVRQKASLLKQLQEEKDM